jgi:HK97 gp10 family phage protein
MSVGVRGGSKSANDKLHPWYWRLKELGTEKQAADPFMRPALEQNIDAVTDKFISEINSEIDKLMQGN